MGKRIRVLFLSAEAAPLVKIGGLGDVAGSLPSALRNLPESPDVRLVLPLYPQIKQTKLELKPLASFHIPHRREALLAETYQAVIEGRIFYLIDGPPIAASPAVYSGDNLQDGIKFTFFSLAALQLSKYLHWQPDILHAHDWHTSPAVYHLSLTRKQDVFFEKTKSLLTVHNLPYLGSDTAAALAAFGLPRAHMSPLPDWAEGLPLPLGLLTADKINTVSPEYAREMLTPEFGAHLEDFLQTRQRDLTGILNGLDMDSWDPASDPALPVNFSVESLSQRIQNKQLLQEELGLPLKPGIPLLAMINRMDYQKGVDLVPDALRQISDLDWQAVILGTGDPELEASARTLDRDFPQVRSVLTFDGALARRIYGGSDLILIPSRYEPCGLTQMIGMRYGCVPLARDTGGLHDTIRDYHQGKANQSTGFLFQDPSSQALGECLRMALTVYQDKRRWQGLQRRGMKKDFSWEKSAREYLKLYIELLSG